MIGTRLHSHRNSPNTKNFWGEFARLLFQQTSLCVGIFHKLVHKTIYHCVRCSFLLNLHLAQNIAEADNASFLIDLRMIRRTMVSNQMGEVARLRRQLASHVNGTRPLCLTWHPFLFLSGFVQPKEALVFFQNCPFFCQPDPDGRKMRLDSGGSMQPRLVRVFCLPIWSLSCRTQRTICSGKRMVSISDDNLLMLATENETSFGLLCSKLVSCVLLQKRQNKSHHVALVVITSREQDRFFNGVEKSLKTKTIFHGVTTTKGRDHDTPN